MSCMTVHETGYPVKPVMGFDFSCLTLENLEKQAAESKACSGRVLLARSVLFYYWKVSNSHVTAVLGKRR